MVAKLLLWFLGFNTGDIYRDGAFAKTPGFSYKKDDTVIAVKTHHPFWDDNNGPDPSAPKGRYWERYVCSVVAYDQWSGYFSLFAYGIWILWTPYITFSNFLYFKYCSSLPISAYEKLPMFISQREAWCQTPLLNPVEATLTIILM